MNLKYKLKILFIFLIIFTAYNTYGQVIISESYEGSSSNKWIEVTNVGSATINLTSPQL
jgi:predicted extracellular nuclease